MTRDLMPDSIFAKTLTATAAGLLYVEPDLVWGLGLVLFFNLVASLWLSYVSDERTAKLVIKHLSIRILVYAITLPPLVILSHMADVAVLRKVAFSGVAGWEAATTLGMGARIYPRFRPLYLRLVRLIDKHTPFDLSEEDIRNDIDHESQANAS